jgi:class 3 adenylate cyclase
MGRKTKSGVKMKRDHVRPEEVAGQADKAKYADTFGNVMRGYQRTLLLGPFADSGRSPKMADVEVAVCFADLRGFTQYVHLLQKDGQDNKVQHFLKDYFQIYPRAVLRSIWSLEPDKPDERIAEEEAEIKRLVVPTTYKNLGDGMMIVWELQNSSSMTIQGLATRFIFGVIKNIQEIFSNLTKGLTPVQVDSWSRHAADLKLGFGLSRGHAWRLDFGYHLPPDYAGSIVNMAARLQGLARPSGIVAQLGFSESLFNAYAKEKNGRIVTIPSPRGLGAEPIQVWISNDVQIDKSA